MQGAESEGIAELSRAFCNEADGWRGQVRWHGFMQQDTSSGPPTAHSARCAGRDRAEAVAEPGEVRLVDRVQDPVTANAESTPNRADSRRSPGGWAV